MVNLYQVFALGIVFLMVASMVGYSFLSAPNTTPTDETPETIPDDLQVAQDIRSYYAEGVEAEVIQLFPVIMVTAGTDETEIYRIDEAIYSIPGVSQVTSQYNSSSLGLSGSSLVYVGTVSFDPTYPKEEILAGIAEIPSLEVADVVQTGLVKVPVETRLKAEDDANLFKEYRFDEPFMEAILSFETAKGDKVEALQRMVFNGDQVLQAMVFEMKNLTGEQVSFVVRLIGVELLELKPEFTFGAAIEYSGSTDFSWLETAIESLPEVESVALDVQPVQYQVSLPIDADLPGEVLTDLNYALHTLENVKRARFWHRDGFDEVTLDFEAEADYALLTSEIDQAFAESGASYRSMDAPLVSIFGVIETDSDPSMAFEQDFKDLLEEKGLSDIELLQSALVDLDAQEFPGPEAVFYLDENQAVQEALVFPGHQEGDRLEVDVSVYGAREKVTRLNAFEVKGA